MPRDKLVDASVNVGCQGKSGPGKNSRSDSLCFFVFVFVFFVLGKKEACFALARFLKGVHRWTSRQCER